MPSPSEAGGLQSAESSLNSSYNGDVEQEEEHFQRGENEAAEGAVFHVCHIAVDVEIAGAGGDVAGDVGEDVLREEGGLEVEEGEGGAGGVGDADEEGGEGGEGEEGYAEALGLFPGEGLETVGEGSKAGV